MTKFIRVLFLVLIATGCSDGGTPPATPSDSNPPGRQTVLPKVGAGSCSDSVVRDLAVEYVKEDVRNQGMPVSQCEVEGLERTDPANIADETIHFMSVLKCDGEYVPYYIFDAKQGKSGPSGTPTCTLSAFHIPPSLAPVASAPMEWTIDQFVSELEANKYATIEDALSALPETVRSSFTFLYEGHGLRGTSSTRPGVILFSSKGEYAITFGDESQELGNELEIYRFDTKTNRGELVRAAFTPESRRRRTPGITVEKNPTQCLGCHSTDPMMRWGTYGKWPGAFGSNDDTIDLSGTDPESKSFLSFMKARPDLPRYRTLIPPVGETGIFPFWDESPVSPYTALRKDGRAALRPNFRLNTVVTLVDARRLARKMMESSEYPKNRGRLLYSMLNCDRDYTNFASALEKVGIMQGDLEPNILAVLKPEQLPEFSDGYSSYGPGRNSVVDYAANIVYRDLLVDHPELGGNYDELSEVDALGSDYWVFGSYPLTVQAFTDARNLGSFLSPKTDSAEKEFCTKLKKVMDEE